uniref:hypothetical protein n=1 Tax=Halomonas citrativorans TaxID=2742612 RepID=UPI001D01DFE3
PYLPLLWSPYSGPAQETNSTPNVEEPKISKLTSVDDFTEIPEGKFIEFCRSAKIITNDVRKILDEKLGTRNSSAHPSGISISELKATEFIQDLVENVVLKYKI